MPNNLTKTMLFTSIYDLSDVVNCLFHVFIAARLEVVLFRCRTISLEFTANWSVLHAWPSCIIPNIIGRSAQNMKTPLLYLILPCLTIWDRHISPP